MSDLVLLHGWGASASSWDAHRPRLAATHQVLAPDLPGHGGTPAPPGGASIPATMATLAARLGVPENATRGGRTRDSPGPNARLAVVVGHSMGAQVAVLLARDHPHLVRALVVIDPAFGADDEELAGCPDRLLDLRERGAEAGVEFVDRACDPTRAPAVWRAARRQMRATPGPVLADLYRSMYLDDGAIGGRLAAAECLAELTRPVLALYSTDEAAGWARSVRLPPGSRVVTWPGRTHYLHQEQPDAFCDLLLSFTASV